MISVGHSASSVFGIGQIDVPSHNGHFTSA
jgi:hypothetical protein